jgi:hypothetical protein
MNTFQTPVLLIIFNRPDHARTVVQRIREAKPAKLFIAADGPRIGNSQDQEKCRITREVVMNSIDWDCEVKTLFRNENLGCGLGPAHAINWFFNHVEKGIILEDDCLPDLSFFPYCEQLLKRYNDVYEVMHISGNNFQNGRIRGEYSYYFSAYTHNWGWATWRDRWQLFDFDMEGGHDKEFVQSISDVYRFNKQETEFWQEALDSLLTKNRKDVWDFRWMFAVWKNHGLSVLPQVNLVKNIGLDADATHTYNMPDSLKSMTAGNLAKIQYPPNIILNKEADMYSFQNHFNPQQKKAGKFVTLFVKALRKIFSLTLLPYRLQMQFFRFRNYTMIPQSIYKANLRLAYRFSRVRGCVVECGTWKGGMIAGMVKITGADKAYYLFDSFEGLPDVKEIDGKDAKAWQSNKDGSSYFNNCTADEADAKNAMKLSGANRVHIIKGWFNETLKHFDDPEGISILRLDGDWYDSTMECLINLFPKINEGGVVILDDYYTWEGCSKALHDYLSFNKLPYRIQSYKNICYVVKE